MRSEYDIVFLSASSFALGVSARLPENCLILEAGEGLGGEFVDALYPDVNISRPAGEGAALYDELLARHIMTEESANAGKVHIPAVNLVFNRLVLEKGINIVFHARPLSMRRENGQIRVEIICNAKQYTLRCRKVVDTRSSLDGVRKYDPEATCALRANMYAPSLLAGGFNGLTLHEGFLPGEAFLSMPVKTPSIQDDAETLMRAFEARPAEYLDLRMLNIAHAYAICARPIRIKTDIGWYIPGCGFENPIGAWAAGLSEREVLS